MTVEATTCTSPAPWLTMRLAGALIAAGGELPDDAALALARDSFARRPGMRVLEAMRPLEVDDVVVHVDGVWYVPNLADLGAWLADALEAREDAGVSVNPVIPSARSAAA